MEEQLDLVVHACNLSTREVQAGGSEVQGQPWLGSKFLVSLSYVRPCLKEKEKEMETLGLEMHAFNNSALGRQREVGLSRLDWPTRLYSETSSPTPTPPKKKKMGRGQKKWKGDKRGQ